MHSSILDKCSVLSHVFFSIVGECVDRRGRVVVVGYLAELWNYSEIDKFLYRNAFAL